MLTLKDHAVAAIEDYWRLNQIKSHSTSAISAVWENKPSNEFQQGIYVALGDETTLYLVTQFNDRTVPKTELQVYKQINHLVFDEDDTLLKGEENNG